MVHHDPNLCLMHPYDYTEPVSLGSLICATCKDHLLKVLKLTSHGASKITFSATELTAPGCPSAPIVGPQADTEYFVEGVVV